MKNYLKNNKKAIFLIILVLIFYVVIGCLILKEVSSSNIVAITAPLTFSCGFLLWKTQELLKRKADSAEEMYRAFHLYAIQVCKLDFKVIEKFKKFNFNLNSNQIDLLENEYKKVIELQTDYLVKSNSFYRVANIPKDIQVKIHNKLLPCFSIVKTVEDILDNPTRNQVASSIRPAIFNIDYATEAGDAIKELVQPYIQFIKF